MKENQFLPFKAGFYTILEWRENHFNVLLHKLAEMQETCGELSPNNIYPSFLSSLLLAKFPMSISIQGTLWSIWPTEIDTNSIQFVSYNIW